MSNVEELNAIVAEDKAVSRIFSIGDPTEHFIYYPIYKAIMKGIADMRIKAGRHGMQIGLRKNSRDRPNLIAQLNDLTSGWSGFDASAQAEMLRWVWRALLRAFDCSSARTRIHFANVTNFFEKNFIPSVYFTESKVVKTTTGVASGSIFMSRSSGSVINFIVLDYLLHSSRDVEGYMIMVYGDDTIVGSKARANLAGKDKKMDF